MSVDQKGSVCDFLSAASTWIPESLNKSAWLEHAPFAFWLIETHEPRVLIELGTHLGYSFFSFCQAIVQLKLSTRAYAVDTWKGDEHAGFYDEEVFQAVSKHNAERYSGFAQLVRSTFDDALPYFEDGSVDLLHIDGRHFYEDVKHDFDLWLPKLSDRGIVLLHDTNVRERSFGVFRWWTDLSHSYPHFQFFHGWGLGVLAVGKKLPRRLRALFETENDREQANKVRHIYARLGASLGERLGNQRLKGELRFKEVEASALKGQVSALEAQLGESSAALAARTAEHSGVKAELADVQQKAAHDRRGLEELLDDRAQLLSEAGISLENRNQRIGQLEAQLDDRAHRLSEADAALEDRGRRIRELEALLDDRTRQLSEADAALEDRGRRIRKLEALLDDRTRQLSEADAALEDRGERIGKLEARLNDVLHQVVSRTAQLDNAMGALAKEKANAVQVSGELQRRLNEAEKLRHAISTSTAWRATGPIRAALSRLSTGQKRQVRRMAKAAYWMATPWNTPKRIRYLRERALRNSRSPSIANIHPHPFGEPALRNLSRLTPLPERERPRPEDIRQSLINSRLFDPGTYLELHEDLRGAGADPWEHFLKYGFWEGRRFTTPEIVAQALAHFHRETHAALEAASQILKTEPDEDACADCATLLASQRVRIGIYCSSQGNFFMQEIANLIQWQLVALKIDAHLRTEQSAFDEAFDIRLFVAPHEFFWLGGGEQWRTLAGAPGTVLYNVEQVHTPWFCRAFPFLLEAPLILDINFQSTLLLRQMGLNALHYMPPYLSKCPYTVSQPDVSGVDLVRGYEFSRARFDWKSHRGLTDRPIDILFVGTDSERRRIAIERLRELTDRYRFICIYTHQHAPLTNANYQTTSPEINCALAQRSKIVLNIHRSWLGYFEWSRMVMQGFWQGACVVSDPSLPNPIFKPNNHFLEENIRHLPELLHWLLGTSDGRMKIEHIAEAGQSRARSRAARTAMLLPMLSSLRASVGLGEKVT